MYYTNAISKAATCRKSAKAMKTNSIYYTRALTSLIMVVMGGIKSQPCHITATPCCNNVYIAFGDYLLLLRYRRLQRISNIQEAQTQYRRWLEGFISDESSMTGHLQDRSGREDIWNRISILQARCARGTGMFARLTVGERIAKQGFIGPD